MFNKPCGSKEDGDDWFKPEKDAPRKDGDGGAAAPSYMRAFYADESVASTVSDQQRADVYRMDGVRILSDADAQTLRQLPKGVYVIRSTGGRMQGKNGCKYIKR